MKEIKLEIQVYMGEIYTVAYLHDGREFEFRTTDDAFLWLTETYPDQKIVLI